MNLKDFIKKNKIGEIKSLGMYGGYQIHLVVSNATEGIPIYIMENIDSKLCKFSSYDKTFEIFDYFNKA